jgi:hypothetical protein
VVWRKVMGQTGSYCLVDERDLNYSSRTRTMHF